MLPSKEVAIKLIIDVLGDAGREVLNTIIDNEVDEALAYERKFEVKRAIKAFYEAKVEDKVIIQLLHDYWKISEYSAMEALRIEKTVNNPRKVLIKYLQNQGYKNSYIREFIRNNNVEKQLENNPSLWKLSPEKLVKKIEENEKRTKVKD